MQFIQLQIQKKLNLFIIYIIYLNYKRQKIVKTTKQHHFITKKLKK